MTAHTHEDGFHEIQLNGKQLVFLFMAATVSGVVIFLSGVMVGRQVRAERVSQAQEQPIEEPLTADVVARPPTIPLNDATVDPKTPPPAPIDDLSYPQRLDQPNPPPDKLVAAARKPTPPPAKEPVKEAVKEPAKAPAKTDAVSAAAKPSPPAANVTPPVAKAPVAAPAATPPAPAAETAASAPAPGSGFAVQVAALNVRGEADAIAKRLSAKGYPAYVQTPNGATNVFRVRVGSYKTRREADAMAAKLQKEEQFKPWVTR